ncbi:MAG: hypothetical protein IPK46_14940 [Saprospiraceae bacterium]|nr:hypothetical protein [Saprospiraceae bacterium]
MKTRISIFVTIYFLCVAVLSGQNRYWVGGSGTWHDAAHWSLTSGGAGGASVPDSTNDVFFNAQSFSADGQYVANLTTQLDLYCKSITFANIDDSIDFNFSAGTPGGIYTQARLIAYQHVTLSDKVSFDYDEGRVVLVGDLGRQVTFNGCIVGYFDIQVDENVNVVFVDQVNANKGATMESGNLFLNADMMAGYFNTVVHDTATIDIFFGTRKIQCGWWNSVKYDAQPNTVNLHYSTGYIECKRISPGRYIDYPRVVINTTIPNLLVGSPGIDFNNNSTWCNSNRDVTFQSLAFVSSGILQVLGNPEVLDSTTVAAGVDLKLGVGDTLTCPQWRYLPSGCGGGSFTLRSATNGSQAFIYNNGMDSIFLYNATVKDIYATGSPAKVVNGINNGNNTNLIFGAGAVADVFYWVGNGGNWTDLNHWSMSSGGPSAGCLPDANDIVMFDAASFTLVGQVVEIPQGITSIKDMIWTQPLDTVLIRFLGSASNAAILKVYGSVTLASKVKVARTGTMEWNFVGSGPVTLDTKNVDLLYAVFEGSGQFTLNSAFKSYDPFDINQGYILFKQGSLISNGYNLTCRSFFVSTGGTKTFQLGASDTLTTISFRAVDAFTFPYATHCIIARDFTLDFATANTIIVHKLILLENDIQNVASLSLRKRAQFHYLEISFPGVARVEGDFTLLQDLKFKYKTGGFKFDDFPVAPTGADTIIIQGNVVYPVGACAGSYSIFTEYIDQKVYFSKPSGTLTLQNTLLRNVHTLTTGATYNAQNCTLAGTSQGWNLTATATPIVYYWKGGNGDWDDPSHWSLVSGGVANPGGCVPGIADKVIFDNNSNTGLNPCNIYFPVYHQPVVADVFVLANNKNINFQNAVGSQVFVTDTLWFTNKATSNVYFDMTGTQPAKLINTDEALTSTMDVLISKYNTHVSLDRKLNVGSLAIQSGEFRTNDFDVNASSFNLFPYTNTATANFGTSNIVAATCSFGNVNAILTNTPFKLYVSSYMSSNTSRYLPWVQVNNTASLNLNSLAVGLTFGTLRLMSTFDVVMSAGNYTIEDSLYFGVPGSKLKVAPAVNLTLQGQIYSAGIAGNLCFLQSSTAGSRFDLIHDNNLCVSYLNAKDINNQGPGIMNVINGTDGGNNIGIDFSTPTDMNKLYWRGGSGAWNVASNWSFRSGSCPAPRSPAATDDVYFDTNSDLDPYTNVIMPLNETCKGLYFSLFQDTVALDLGNTLSFTSCEINQAKAVLKNGTAVSKKHIVVNNGSLGLVSAIAAVNQYPSLADSIGFKIGPASTFQGFNSNVLIMGNKNTNNFPALYIDPLATLNTFNADFTIYPPLQASPSMKSSSSLEVR